MSSLSNVDAVFINDHPTSEKLISNIKPNIYFNKKKGGGIKITKVCKLSKLNDKLIKGILQSYKIHNCDNTLTITTKIIK